MLNAHPDTQWEAARFESYAAGYHDAANRRPANFGRHLPGIVRRTLTGRLSILEARMLRNLYREGFEDAAAYFRGECRGLHAPGGGPQWA